MAALPANQSAMSDSDSQGVNMSSDRPSRGNIPDDSSANRETAFIGLGNRGNYDRYEHVSDPLVASSIGTRMSESGSSAANEGRTEGLEVTGQRMSPAVNDSCFHYVEDESLPVGTESAAEPLSCVYDDLPPTPFSLHSHAFEDGRTFKTNGGIETLDSTADDEPPVPLTFLVADASINERLSLVQAAKEQSASSGARPESAVTVAAASPSPRAAEAAESPNQDQSFSNRALAPESRDVLTTANLPVAVANRLSRTLPHEHLRGEEESTATSPPPLPAVSDDLNNNHAFPNREIAQQSRSMRTVVDNTNFESRSSSPIFEGASYLSSTVTDAPAEPARTERERVEEEEEEMIIIPQAFLVEEEAPIQVPFAEIAQLVERNQASPSSRTRRSRLFLVFNAVIAIALGTALAINFTRGNAPAIIQTLVPRQSENRTLLPSPQPSFVQPASQQLQSVRSQIRDNVIERNASFDGNRLLALDWILNEDNMHVGAADSNLYQRYILALLSYEFLISGVSNANGPGWRSEEHECEWRGVTCNDDNYISGLDLSGNGLVGTMGTMPPEVGRLRYLASISLSNNALLGTIPTELGKLTLMSYLDFGYNQITGTVPSEIGNMQELVRIYLWSNRLTGSIPSEIGNLKKLATLAIALNNFNGTIPPWLGQSNLRITDLNLDQNKFTGTLPSEIANITSLVHLNLRSNMLSGTLPSELGSLEFLTYIDIGENQITGTLPSELGSWRELTYLYLRDNQLTGSVPSFRNSKWLSMFDIGINSLSGTIPPWLAESTKLMTMLHLDHNMFTGTLPSEIGTLASLISLDIRSNKIKGTLPSEIGNLASLIYLGVADNRLNGTIPSTLASLKALIVLALDQNELVGTIPSEIGNLFRLTELWLSNNKLTGTLPSEIGYLTLVDTLYAGVNNLSGTVPTEFGNLNELQNLGLENNILTGTIPTELGQLPMLVQLLLQQNKFTGSYPPELKTCTSGLLRLCFQNNLLSGDQPSDCEC